MKTVTLLLFVCAVSEIAVPTEAKCECFEEFQVEIENGVELCRGVKKHRIFNCGEEKPPICTCRRGKLIDELDIGETSCTDPEKQYDSIFCEPKKTWDDYLSRHPNRRIYF